MTENMPDVEDPAAAEVVALLLALDTRDVDLGVVSRQSVDERFRSACRRDWRIGDALRVGVAGGQGEARRGGLRAGGAADRVVVLVDAVGAVVDDPEVAHVGRVERDAGRARRRPRDRPAAEQRAGERVLEHLVGAASLTTQRDVPSVTMSLGSVLPLLRLKLLAAFWLPERRLAAPVYLKTLSCLASTIQTSVPLVAMPSTVALRGQAAGRPGAEQAAAGVVDVDLLVGVHDPDLVAGRGAGGAARGGVAAVQGVVLDRAPPAAVLVGAVRGARR